LRHLPGAGNRLELSASVGRIPPLQGNCYIAFNCQRAAWEASAVSAVENLAQLAALLDGSAESRQHH